MTNNTKQLSILASPLQRIADASEASTNILTQIQQVVLSTNKYALETVQELKKQTSLLLDIKTLLKEQSNQSEGSATSGKTKMPGIIGAAKTGVAIVIMAGALVAASGILGFMQPVTPVQMLTALAIGALFLILVPIFIQISESFKGPGLTDRIIGKVTGVGNGDTPSMNQILGGVGLAMVIMAAGVAASSYIFSLVRPITFVQFATATLIGLSFIVLSMSFALIVRTLEKNGITADKKGFLKIGMVSIAMVSIALGIVGVAYAFMLMPSNPGVPDPLWTFKAAAAIGLFAIGFYFVMKAIKGASLKNIIFGSLAISTIALSLVGIAFIFMLMPDNPPAPDPLWTFKAATAIGLFAIGFYFILKAIKGASLKNIIFASFAIPAIAVGIVGVALIFSMLGEVDNWVAPDGLWTLKAGFAILIFSIPFYLTAKAVKGMSTKDLLFMTIAIPIIAFGVIATAYIFQGLSGVENVAPATDWSVAAGISLVIFAGILYLVGLTMGKSDVKEILKGLLDLVVISFAIVATAWMFQLLPTNMIAPEYDWTLKAALSLGLMGAAIVAMGIATMVLTPAALLLGALGIIVTAVVIVAVGWILSSLAPAMPNLVTVSQGITQVLLAPINGIIDVFARFKNEIGIENMLGLATGVAALGGAWLIFSAAVGGASVVGGIGTAIGGIFEGIGKLFGGDTPSPVEILEKIAAVGPKIQTLSEPLKNIGVGFAAINLAAGGVMKAFEAAIRFNDEIDVDDFNERANASVKIGNSYAKIANASKAMNIKAIDATTNMFKALDDLAKNGGESAMAVLADKLMEAVKQLTGTVVNLEKTVEQQGKATGAVGDALSGAISTVKETITGVKSNVDKMNKDTKEVALDIQPLIDAIQDLEARFDSAIKVIDVTNE